MNIDMNDKMYFNNFKVEVACNKRGLFDLIFIMEDGQKITILEELGEPEIAGLTFGELSDIIAKMMRGELV